MTANELLNSQIETVTYMLEKVTEGVKESDVDFKVAPTAMSMRELVEHLCEVYTAVEEGSRGVDHAWGEFSIDDKSWSNLTAQCKTLRDKAVEIVTTSSDPKILEAGSAFIVGHDNYHIGQFSTIRLATDSTWNPYSIYKGM